jgi:hypothetical protein
LFSVLYPDTASGYLEDPSIADQSINEIWTGLAACEDTMLTVVVGFSSFCFYCEAAESHDAEDCQVKPTIVCQLYKNANGKKNAKYPSRAVGHQTSRCRFQYKHAVRPFPPWPEQLNLSLEMKRKLSQAMAVKDFKAIGSIFYSEILNGGLTGNNEVEDLEKQEEAKQEEAKQEEAKQEEAKLAEEDSKDDIQSLDL